VFFTDARIPAENLLGTENDGWRLAKLTLGNERVSLSTGGVLWGMGPTTAEVLERSGDDQPVLRDAAVQLHITAEVLRLLGYRIVSDLIQRRAPGPQVAVKKLLADKHGQAVMEWMLSQAGTGGLERNGEDSWAYLFSRALTIGGGTTEVLKNIIGEQILGLAKDTAVN
jgi:alkylation response protein AidB-like acyl-CoA dehydrogenase